MELGLRRSGRVEADADEDLYQRYWVCPVEQTISFYLMVVGAGSVGALGSAFRRRCGPESRFSVLASDKVETALA